jgi:DNA-nicking Smr family endonuclease
MTRARRPRLPTAEERALWNKVAKTVEPLHRQRTGVSPTDEQPAPLTKTTKTAKPQKKASAAPTIRPTPKPQPPEPPRLAPFDRRLMTRLGKGTVAIDARIDLHGLTQEAAHFRLRNFLVDSQAAGAKVVLVITGKGRRLDTVDFGRERGVLRRLVPIWLGSSELRPYVVGYETAGRGHGGEGALYVRIRSGRKGRK